MNGDGVVVVDKPAGVTSHDVVDRVRKIFGTRKVGHGGTLDPDATGVLLVGLGRATRLLSYAQAGPKRYRTVARLGVTTTTQDASGEILEERPVDVTEAQVRTAFATFTGAIEQIPPMVSAVKVGGERLYSKARRGEQVERAPRKVTVYEFELVAFRPPQVTVDVLCSGGTYVRTLLHDAGQELGTGAHVVTLRRTEAAGFTESDAIALDELTTSDLRPLLEAVKDLPAVEVDADSARRISHGQSLDLEFTDAAEAQPIALVHGGSLLAVYVKEGHRLIPDRVLSS